MSSSSAAATRLNQLIAEIQQQSPKTLAFWRLSHAKVVEALKDFASAAELKDGNKLLDEVQALFRDKLNPLLAEQESSVPALSNKSNNGGEQEVSVVFGGKYSTIPASISEVLVSKLIAQSPQVITVSRSSSLGANKLPNNLTHVAKQNLDAPVEGGGGVGVQEFKDVMGLAVETFQSNDKANRIAFYLTLGQHKGVNPFVRNIQAAQNFCQALQQTMDTTSQSTPWRVVLTGTDAALPSTHPDGKVTIDNEELAVPSYKIMQYNYVYAMSKLGQYYLVVNAVANLVGRKEIVEETAPIIEKIQKHVFAAGEDGDYHADTALIKMEELDGISRRIVELCDRLSDHFWIATGISICYTPLHAKPWTEAAIKTDSPRGHVIEQIVRRLKNAISIEKAAGCHFPSSGS